MKKQTFFLTSLPLALAALGSQAVGWYCLLTAAASFSASLLITMLQPLPFHQSMPDHQQFSDGNVFRILIWSGLVLAILSLFCVIASFRRRESGWRLISIILLNSLSGDLAFLSFVLDDRDTQFPDKL